MAEHPLFAVVGHPNKGKSSVVAALTQDDQVAISELSGTTLHSQYFRLQVQQRTLLELVDTPGFQRAEECLQWLQQSQPAVHLRPQRVAEFVQFHAQNDSFRDEVELLTPIVQGAGIIYVVDGSLPWSPEYETEMEILRWSAQPRLALINPIDGEHFVDEWQQALSQYFSLVRVFNPMHASFEQHLVLLRAFAQLEADHGRLDPLLDELKNLRLQRLQQAARLITERLAELLQHHLLIRPELSQQFNWNQRFNLQLNKIEKDSQTQLEKLFLHHDLKTQQNQLELLPGELMDRELWSIWGLDQQRLTLIAAAAGASLGFGADLMVGGHSLMLGSLGGGVAGGLSAWLGKDWVKQKLPAWMPQSKRQQLGPVSDVNFGFVALGRALQHARALLQLSHADRRELQVEEPPLLQELSKKQQIQLLKWFLQLRRSGLSSGAAEKLENWILKQLKQI